MIQRISLPFPASSIELFEAFRDLPLPILLHSGTSKDKSASRFDIIVADPQKLFIYQDGTLRIESAQSIEKIQTSEPILALEEYFPINNEAEVYEDIPFYGGLLGYFAYDAMNDAHKIFRDYDKGPDLPSVLAGLYDWAIIVDHEKKNCTLAAHEAHESEKLQVIKKLLSQKRTSQDKIFELTSSFNSNLQLQEYRHAFDKIMNYIHAGDCYQVNMAQCFQAECKGDSLQAFIKLQQKADAPFAAYIEYGKQAVLSFSPECFLQVRNKKVITQPIKGTRARFDDARKDEEALVELQSSKKDKAENLMIVDLLRNDLGKVCRTGSVHVDALYETQSFANVHHLVSTVSAELLQAKDVFKLLNACFPGGSITGAPKQRAMEIIAELETMPRSVYCGSIAWINMNGDMGSNIAIRTLVRDHDRLYCWGGGGIVADSAMQMEYQESLDKISMFMDALS
jgi:para-aminobenzoate synthetase component 1